MINDLPAFHTWQIHKDFPEKSNVKINTYNYQVLAGCHSPAASKAQAEKQTQIAILVPEQDEEEFLLDLPLLNGKPNSQKYNNFWDEVKALNLLNLSKRLNQILMHCPLNGCACNLAHKIQDQP